MFREYKVPPHLEQTLKDTLALYTHDKETDRVYYMRGTSRERDLGYWPEDDYLKEDSHNIKEEDKPKGQTRKGSILEAILNVFSGAFIAFFLTELLAPSLGIGITGTANLKLTIILTIVSVIRGYLWRRYFNGKV